MQGFVKVCFRVHFGVYLALVLGLLRLGLRFLKGCFKVTKYPELPRLLN